MSCLYKIKPLPVTLFANIFSHSISCLFNIVYDFLCYVEFFKFDDVPFKKFLLLVLLGDLFKNQNLYSGPFRIKK